MSSIMALRQMSFETLVDKNGTENFTGLGELKEQSCELKYG